MSAVWNKFTSQLGALLGDERGTAGWGKRHKSSPDRQRAGADRPTIRPSCSFSMLNQTKLKVFRPSHSTENLNCVQQPLQGHCYATTLIEHGRGGGGFNGMYYGYTAPFASPEDTSDLSNRDSRDSPATRTGQSSSPLKGKAGGSKRSKLSLGRIGGLSFSSSSNFLLHNLRGRNKSAKKKSSIASKVSYTPTTTSSSSATKDVEMGSDGCESDGRRRLGRAKNNKKKSEVDFSLETTIIPNGYAHMDDDVEQNHAFHLPHQQYRTATADSSLLTSFSCHMGMNRPEWSSQGEDSGLVRNGFPYSQMARVSSGQLPNYTYQHARLDDLSLAENISSARGVRALFRIKGAKHPKAQKRSSSVGADSHHNVRQGLNEVENAILKNHASGGGPPTTSASYNVAPASRMTVSRTMCGGFSTPNPKSMANFDCKRAIDAGFLSLAQRDTPVLSSDVVFRRLEKLGEGSYATVFKSENRLDGSIVALKEIKLQPQEGLPFTAIREVSLLKGLKHANIVRLHQIVHQPQSLILVFEYVKTDLSKYMEQYRHGLDPFHTKLILFQLLRGLAYCHERKILHRDIKPQNILISEDCEVKLADFGLARSKSVPTKTFSHDVVTLWYRPPDVLLGSTQYTTSLDIWGVGCILAELCSGVPLFPGANDVVDQLDRIFSVRGLPNTKQWPGAVELPNYNHFHFPPYREVPWHRVDIALAKLQEDGCTLLDRFLQLNPADRISAKEAMRSNYFANNFCSLEADLHHLHPMQSVAQAIRKMRTTLL